MLVLHILNFCEVFNQNYVIPVQKHLHHEQLPLMLSLALLKLSLPIKEKLYVGKCIYGVNKINKTNIAFIGQENCVLSEGPS